MSEIVNRLKPMQIGTSRVPRVLTGTMLAVHQLPGLSSGRRSAVVRSGNRRLGGSEDGNLEDSVARGFSGASAPSPQPFAGKTNLNTRGWVRGFSRRVGMSEEMGACPVTRRLDDGYRGGGREGCRSLQRWIRM